MPHDDENHAQDGDGMLSVYVPRGTTLERMAVEPGSPPSDEAVWIDLVMPTVQEDKLVEKLLGIAVPTREEMQEIEVSSRLYVENGVQAHRLNRADGPGNFHLKPNGVFWQSADDEVHVPQFFCATDVLDIRSSVQIVIGQAGGDP